MTNNVTQKQAGKYVLHKLVFVPLLLILLFIISLPSYGYRILRDSLQPYSLEKENHVSFIRGPVNVNLLKWIQAVPALNDANQFHNNSLEEDNNAIDTIPFIFIKKDQENITRYLISGTFLVYPDSISFKLTDSLVLNYRQWNVSANNRINYSQQGLLATDFLLTNDSASISLTSRQNLTGSPIDIRIENVDIRDVTGILNKDSLLASGLLNATILLNGFGKLLTGSTGTGSIRDFELMQQPVGNLQLAAQMVDENTLHANLALAENDNELNFKGNFTLNNGTRQLDALLDIKKLQVATLKGFFKDLTVSSGSVNGLIALKGKFTRPEWTGSLYLDTIKFTLNQLGTTYGIDKQKISLEYPAIGFNRFIIKDSLDHSLSISGNICSKTLTEYDLDLHLNSQDFTFINAPKAINNQIYGYAGMSANISVTGNARDPSMEGDIHLNEKTDVTMGLPEKNINKDAASSVVQFIGGDMAASPEKKIFRPVAAPTMDTARFSHYKLNIRAGKDASLTIVIDPTTGDELKLKGVAALDASKTRGGKMVYSGTYHLDRGYYELNYQFLKKRFNLMQGSTIHFNGGLTEAQINIRAEYIARTAAKDLLGNEVGSVDPTIARSFNQKTFFRVVLLLKGSLNKPSISFNIELPDDKTISRQLRTTIENKLVQLRADVAATNKQVFALLVLDRFVGEQSMDFFKGNGSDFSDIANESVSKFLSSALDKIASDLFKGINVDLNLNSYKEFTDNDETQKKDLNVDLSKNFLNDRLSVAVGRNFGIESQDAATKASQQKASRFLPDVTLNYKLSTDGKYLLRSYKKSPFEMILDGYVVETGLAFILTMDYDLLNELFYKKKKKRGNSR